jgi:hypothetical protein
MPTSTMPPLPHHAEYAVSPVSLPGVKQDRKKCHRTTGMQIELAQYPNTVNEPGTNTRSRVAIPLSSLAVGEIEDGEVISCGRP